VNEGREKVENGVGEPQVVVLLGGTSEIGQAIVGALAGPATRTVVLASRDPGSTSAFAEQLRSRGVGSVDEVAFEATDHAGHDAFVRDIAARHGDLDVVIQAFGVLGDQATFDDDPVAAAAAVDVNYTAGVSSGLAVAAQLRRQGHGTLVVISSVAGERVRKANFVYGSSKAGLDGFAQGLGDALAGSGARVLVVRPGFVPTRMTEGMKPAPFSSTPDAVAQATVKGLRRGARTVWAPGILRVVFMGLRHLPGAAWRRLPM
jgi:decaprenylphospho-beta-D-erythro-pentofuranosid-2-ulose 2-reductase